MDSSLLELLCCPKSHHPLREATPAEVSALQKLKPDADGGLVCEQTAEIYPIRSGIPILITGEETPLASLSLN